MLQTSIRASVGTSGGRFFEFLKLVVLPKPSKNPWFSCKDKKKPAAL
jgi:hypothetical protein